MPFDNKKSKRSKMSLIAALLKKGLGKRKKISKDKRKKSLAEQINFGDKFKD